MAYITEISADGELNTALNNFNTVCAANSATLGLSPADLTAIAAAATGFNTTFNAATTAKAAAKNSVEAKDMQKKASKAVVSKWAKTFRANQTIPDNLLDALMLPHHKTPGNKTAPTQPLALVGNGDGQGLVNIKWNRNGNTQGTQFIIETRGSAEDDWTFLAITTKTKFTHQASPGSYIAFRVTATRRNLLSPPSVPIVLWENGGSGSSSLSIAA